LASSWLFFLKLLIYRGTFYSENRKSAHTVLTMYFSQLEWRPNCHDGVTNTVLYIGEGDAMWSCVAQLVSHGTFNARVVGSIHTNEYENVFPH
jgi:hypothetical protein